MKSMFSSRENLFFGFWDHSLVIKHIHGFQFLVGDHRRRNQGAPPQAHMKSIFSGREKTFFGDHSLVIKQMVSYF